MIQATLKTTSQPCAGGLSMVNTIDKHLRDLINSKLARSWLTLQIDAVAGSEGYDGKHQSQPGCGE